jgi:phage-related protein
METNWHIDFYKSQQGHEPISEFIKSLPVKDQVKVIWTINLLRECGINLKMPHARVIEGETNLFELRVQLANNIQRIFYFHYIRNSFVLLHGFTKKTQKTPQREIKTAKDRKVDYVRQKEVTGKEAEQHAQKIE